MQSGLSVQFDDLFKKAWEEDAVGEQEEDGIYNFLITAVLLMYILGLEILALHYKLDQTTASLQPMQSLLYQTLFQFFCG